MNPFSKRILQTFVVVLAFNTTYSSWAQAPELYALFEKWRAFENPQKSDGSFDYSQRAFQEKWPEFLALRETLNTLYQPQWPTATKVDWTLLWAEMNGYDFNHHVLKPWQRDPAFYKVLWTDQSDVPAHEGPTNHAVIEWWQYAKPLTKQDREDLRAKLEYIPAFYDQAKTNLTGNARELWVAGIRDIKSQMNDLEKLAQEAELKSDKKIQKAIKEAILATQELTLWLEEAAPSMNGPSGVGTELYSWYQNNVHLVPLSWEDEVMLLKRELARAWSSLALEEHKNRHLAPINAADSEAAYQTLASKAADELVSFLDREEIVSVKEYFRPALEPHLGRYIPADQRNFFWITAHLDPKPLYSHFYHWFELARMHYEPHANAIRRGALLYNIFDSRNEGMATAVEEFFMQTGLYENNPRAREIVYILIAQRAARGLGSLYAHANERSMEEAGTIHADYTPRGWMKTEKELLLFEQHLYMRQPGYGTSYITGKYLMEHTLMNYAKSLEGSTNHPNLLKSYFDGMNRIGNIPVTLGQWELTGSSELIDQIMDSYVPLEVLLQETIN
jgi:hypothetical protein